jgi:hypothetical protein
MRSRQERCPDAISGNRTNFIYDLRFWIADLGKPRTSRAAKSPKFSLCGAAPQRLANL